jgi:hypothetical protein
MGFHFNGSLFDTLRQCARAYAESALPDTSVVGSDEDAHAVAIDLENFWHEQAVRSGDLEIPKHGDENALDVGPWRDLCRDAIEARIVDSRPLAAARRAYAALCAELGTDPIAEENAILSIGRGLLPPCALAVLDADQGDKSAAATVEYYDFLTEQTQAAQDAHEAEIAAGHEWHGEVQR